ncbi:MAG: hypothetical protein V9F03_13185 [Microthrixaceae bacterium]
MLSDGARCYISLKSMGDPPPKSPREVLKVGENRSFVVQGFDTPRRGVDLALPDLISVGVQQAGESETSSARTSSRSGSSAVDQPLLTQGDAEEATVATAKKAPAKKATAS